MQRNVHLALGQKKLVHPGIIVTGWIKREQKRSYKIIDIINYHNTHLTWLVCISIQARVYQKSVTGNNLILHKALIRKETCHNIFEILHWLQITVLGFVAY